MTRGQWEMLLLAFGRTSLCKCGLLHSNYFKWELVRDVKLSLLCVFIPLPPALHVGKCSRSPKSSCLEPDLIKRNSGNVLFLWLCIIKITNIVELFQNFEITT